MELFGKEADQAADAGGEAGEDSQAQGEYDIGLKDHRSLLLCVRCYFMPYSAGKQGVAKLWVFHRGQRTIDQ